MKRKTKFIVAAMCVCFLVGIAGGAVIFIHLFSSSGWPQRVAGPSFTTTKPKNEDVTGSYLIKGTASQLDLNADGTFQAANYPLWKASATGNWALVTPGITYPNPGAAAEPFWAIKLTATDGKVETLELTGNAAPYGLVRLDAEADEGAMFSFEKKK